MRPTFQEETDRSGPGFPDALKRRCPIYAKTLPTAWPSAASVFSLHVSSKTQESVQPRNKLEITNGCERVFGPVSA